MLYQPDNSRFHAMLWLAAYLPYLPLEVFSRALPSDMPMAVSINAGGSHILLCNRAATAKGVRPGLAPTAAQALAADLRVLPRDETTEHAALNQLAVWAGQYTSHVSLELPQALLLEVAGSLKLFGSANTILKHMQDGLSGLGYIAWLALAPTPQGALLLARGGQQSVISDKRDLPGALASFPLHYLPLDKRALNALYNMGLQKIADLLRLPRQGLRRRLGPVFMDYLNRLLGQTPEPRKLFQPPPRFSGQINLPAEVETTDALQFGCKRLLLEMCGYLSARGCGAQQLDWTLLHAATVDTRFSLGLLQPERDPDYLQELLRERLERLTLAAPALAIRLDTEHIQTLNAETTDLFAQIQTRQQNNPYRLLERLRARLSEEAIHGLTILPDYRPEHAWTHCHPGESSNTLIPRQRPLWLLSQPQPLEVRNGHPWWGAPLELEPERERIESGWWDGKDITRDYFIAHTPQHERLWIYREITPPKKWYLHGFWG